MRSRRRPCLPLILWLGSLGLPMSMGCVVQYGEAPEAMVLPADMQAPPVDFSEAITRIDLLLEGEQDVDRLDRLLAMRDLARRMRRADPRAQQEVLFYLQQMIAVEERAQPVETAAVYDDEIIASFTPLSSPIVEESLDVSTTAAPRGATPGKATGLAGQGSLRGLWSKRLMTLQ